MNKINIDYVINDVINDINEEREQGILMALQNTPNLADVFCFLTIKKSLVIDDRESLISNLKNPELFFINYGTLEGLLQDSNFADAFRTNMEEAVFTFSYEGRKLLKNGEIELAQSNEQMAIIYEAINELITNINAVPLKNEKVRLQALRKLLVKEEVDSSNLFNNFISNNFDYLQTRYGNVLDNELAIYIVYYLMQKEDIFFDRRVLRGAKPYLKKLENLYQNYQNYNIFERNLRIKK